MGNDGEVAAVLNWEYAVKQAELHESTKTFQKSADSGGGLEIAAIPKRRHQQHIERKISGLSKKVRDCFRSLIRGESDWPLFISGEAGRGKTCAALTLADYVPESRRTHYSTLSELAREWQDTQIDAKLYRSKIEQWQLFDLTIVDEIGVRSPTEYQFELLLSLFDARLHRPTIWISNLLPDGIESTFDSRAFSRLCSGTVLLIDGDDRRIKGMTSDASRSKPHKRRS